MNNNISMLLNEFFNGFEIDPSRKIMQRTLQLYCPVIGYCSTNNYIRSIKKYAQ